MLTSLTVLEKNSTQMKDLVTVLNVHVSKIRSSDEF